MRTFISYCKKQLLWMLTLFLCVTVLSLVLYLNGISSGEIFYGVMLCIFFFVVVIGYDFYKYIKKHKQLKQLKNSILIQYTDIPEAVDLIEQDYQELIELIHLDKMEQTNQIEGKRKEMTEYYSMWVHQIKTPIAAMRLLLQAVRRKHEAEEATTESFSEVETRELEDELFLIEQYVGMALQYLRLDSETTDFILQEQELDEIIRDAVHKYAKLFIRKKISLHYEGVVQKVLTDKKWLEFVLEQILSNAIKYTHAGSISIYLDEDAKSLSKALLLQNNPSGWVERDARVYLVIEDTGIGIRQEDLPRVCEKGYTGYNGHADKHSSGIGLYLCNRILHKLGHTIEITSEVGKGTKVRIGIPLEQE